MAAAKRAAPNARPVGKCLASLEGARGRGRARRAS